MRFFLAPVITCAIVFGAMRPAWAGPPYLTDDPVPVAYRNYEIYIGYEGEYGNGESETSLPFAEINYGPLPNVQIAGSFSLTKSGNDDFGIKYRFIPEGASRPQVAFYPSVSNTQSVFLPLWAQKNIGRVTLFGGGGWSRSNVTGGQNYWSGGLAGTYDFSNQVNAGLENLLHRFGSNWRTRLDQHRHRHERRLLPDPLRAVLVRHVDCRRANRPWIPLLRAAARTQGGHVGALKLSDLSARYGNEAGHFRRNGAG
jgi:hypothetical protein